MKKLFTYLSGLIVIVLLVGLQKADAQLIDNGEIIIDSVIAPDGRIAVKVIVPGIPPDDYRAPIAYPTETSNILPNVPAFDWSFGCSSTSAAMIAGHYDNMGYPDMYNGPTNGGVMPMNNSSWPDVWINGELRHQCPLSATRDGVDGRTIYGHVDDYWVSYGSTAADPYIGNWTQHTYNDCTGDYMKTNQSAYGNVDASTTFWYWTNNSPMTASDLVSSGNYVTDGGYGFKLFYESRGYTVTDMYNQRRYGYNGISAGFTYADFMAEIDAGRPVLIQVTNHTMVGYGYDDGGGTNTVYIHDTWDYSNHTMIWGGYYSGLLHRGVTIVELAPSTINVWTGATNQYWGNSGNWSLGHIPTATEDVEIPNVNMPCIVDFSDKTCNNLLIYAGATVNIYDQVLTVNVDMTNHGTIGMLQDDAYLNIMHDVVWESGSSLNVTAYSSFIQVWGDWNFEPGANVNPTLGFVDFEGTSTSWIRCYSDNCSFYKLRIYKSGGANAKFSNLSTQDLVVNSLTFITSSGVFTSSSNHDIIMRGDFNYYGTFDFTQNSNTGSVIFDGITQNIYKYSTNSGLFNNVVFSSSTGTTIGNGELTALGNLTINQGYFSPGSATVNVGGTWTNTVGTGGFVEGTSRVRFNKPTNGVQFINSSEHFNIIENDASFDGIRPAVGTDVTCNVYDWTSGSVSATYSTFTAYDLADNGIYGDYYALSGSQIILYQDAGQYVDLFSSNVLVQNNGLLKIIGGADESYWCSYAPLDIEIISGGILDFDGYGITIWDSQPLTETITGALKTSGWFTCNRSDFNPAGGTFEFYGGTDSRIDVDAGSTFHDLLINKSGGDKSSIQIKDRDGKSYKSSKSNTALLYSDVVVDNELTIADGELTLNGHELTVAHDCYVYGTLNMTNAADILNVGINNWDNLIFYSGSSGNISNGEIYLKSWITTQSGCSFTASTNNTIYFTGGNSSGGLANYESSAVYGNVDVNKSAYRTYLSSTATEPHVVNGNFIIHAGNIFDMQNNTLTVHGVFTDNATSEIYVYAAEKDGVNGASSDKPDSGGSTKSKGGYLEIDTDFTLNGLMDVGDGDVLLHGDFHIASTGTLDITTGTVIADQAYKGDKAWQYLNGTINLTNGLFEISHNSMRFSSTSVNNISGGIIRCGFTFHAIDAGVFQPTDGIVEFTGYGYPRIECSSGNYFNNVLIDRTEGVDLWTDITVQNDFQINSGPLRTFDVYTNQWDIYIGGDWTNTGGDAAFLEGTGTVTFNGTGDVSITPAETFYNLTLDKASSADWLTPTGDLTILNNLVVNPGALYSGDNLISVSGDVTVNSGGALYMQANSTLALNDASNLNVNGFLYVVGSAGNYATVTHQSSGDYGFNINNGGNIGAQYAIFEYMNGNGVFLQPGSNLHPSFTFNHCIFRRGHAAPSALLALNCSDIFTCTGAYFENTFGTTGWNVWKSLNTGDATFVDASGDFAGPEYELDNWDHIHWTAMDVELDLTAMLEGPFNGTDMNIDLNTLGLIPLNQPFNSIPAADWYYTGTESVASVPPNVVDWILVRIKDADDAASSSTAPVVAEQAAFLLNDGSIVDLNGSSNLIFPGITYSNGLFPVVWHRNHLGVISSDKMTRSGGIYTYDFTQAGSAYSNTNPGEKLLSGSIWGMFSGDASGGGVINTFDLTFWSPDAGSQDYLEGDFNLNSQADNKDKNDYWFGNLENESQIPESKNDDN